MTQIQNPKHVSNFKFRILNLFRISYFGFRASRPGVALLLAVLIVSALLATGLGVFDIIFGELRITEELSDSFVALSAADQGIEQLLYEDLVADSVPGCGGASPCTYSPASSFDFGNQRCATLSLRRTGGGQTFAESIGEYRCGSERSVKRRLVTSYEKAATFGFSPDTGGALESGLVAYWPLNETSDGSVPVTRSDVMGSNHLTDNNTVTSNPGIRGNAAQFTAGNSEYLSIGDNADLSAGNIDFTIAAWVLFTGNPASDEVIIQKGSAAMNGLIEYTLTTTGGAANRFRFVVGNGAASSEIVAASAGTVVSNTWYFIVAWHDATADTINIQVSTQTIVGAVDTTSWVGGSYDSSFGFTIGRHVDFASSHWDGRIDEVGIWKRVLSAQERADLWNNGNGNTCASPCQ